jgi:hypothetical protein
MHELTNGNANLGSVGDVTKMVFENPQIARYRAELVICDRWWTFVSDGGIWVFHMVEQKPIIKWTADNILVNNARVQSSSFRSPCMTFSRSATIRALKMAAADNLSSMEKDIASLILSSWDTEEEFRNQCEKINKDLALNVSPVSDLSESWMWATVCIAKMINQIEAVDGYEDLMLNVEAVVDEV